MIRKVAEALDSLSKVSVAHGNLSLNSIVFERKDPNQIKLVDPCLAFNESQASQSFDFSPDSIPAWVTPDFAKDEINKAAEEKDDVYALGALAYELYHGQQPHMTTDTSSIMKARRDGEAPSEESGNSDFDEFIKACLAKDRNQRATLQDLLQTKFITESASESSASSWKNLIENNED